MVSVTVAATAMTMGATGSGGASPCIETHHIATIRNDQATARGGLRTPRFQKIFARAAMTLEDPANKLPLQGHYGPHPQQYHGRLSRPTGRLSRHTARRRCGWQAQAGLLGSHLAALALHRGGSLPCAPAPWNCRSVVECRDELTRALKALSKEIATPGTELNQLVTQ
jgi:hypothetical protein